MLDLRAPELHVNQRADGLIEAGRQPGPERVDEPDPQARGVADEPGHVLELIHRQHQLGIVDQPGRDRTRRGARRLLEGGDVGRQPGVVGAVLDERPERPLVRVGPLHDLLGLTRQLLGAAVVRAQQHQIVDRMPVERLQDVVDDRLARREEADRIEHRRRAR